MKPRVDYEVLRTYHEGIIALSACLAGEVQRCLTRGMYEEAVRASEKYVDIFGKNNSSWSSRTTACRTKSW